VIVVRPVSGLCNRLRVISSFRVLAAMAERDFVVCWGPSPGFSDEHIDELFEHDLQLVDEDGYAILEERSLRLHEAVQMRGTGAERVWTWAPGTDLGDVFDGNVRVVTYTGGQGCDDLVEPFQRRAVLGDSFTEQYRADVRSWRPVRRIRKAVEKLGSHFGPTTTGVHIRRGDAWADPRPDSPYQRSTDQAFMQAMDEALGVEPATTFFLATDSADTEARFRQRYGDALLTNTKKTFVPSVPSRAKGNQRDAVIDLFALARTSRILASHYSSFSTFAAILGGIPRTDAVETEERSVPDRIRHRRSIAAGRGPEPCDLVASFAMNHVGLGHTSRLIAVHDAMRAADGPALSSLFFADDHRQLIEDYGFAQLALPRFPGAFMGSAAEPSPAGDLSRGIVELALAGARPVVLHDVFVHRALYDAAVAGGWPQALIYRSRTDVKNPVEWVRRTVPAIGTIFWIGKQGLVREDADICVYGVDDVARHPLGELPLWTEPLADLRVMVTAGGGGRPDAEAFLHAAIAAVDIVSRRSAETVAAHLVTGPFYGGPIRLAASSPASYAITRYVPPTHSLYWGSSVVVSQSGYNTVTELGRSGVPHVLVPSDNFGSDDQRQRAVDRALTGATEIQVVDADAEEIAKAIEYLTAKPPAEWTPVLPRGASQIAEALRALAGAVG